MKELDYNKYNKFVQEILTEIQDAKNKAAYKINESIIQLYFRIGEVIVEKQTLFGWGKSIVEKLSIDLKNMNYGMEDENPSIGIILCAEKDNFEVEFSLKGIDKPMGVAEYTLTRKLPKKYQGQLPTVEELKREIDNTLSND